MFEHVPPPQPTPPVPALEPRLQPQLKPLAAPKAAPIPLADQASIELFKRTSLNGTQKIGLVVLAVIVLTVLVGVGIWLFMTLDPFAQPLRERDQVNANNATVNSTNIPLQELDTDKDGIRDIDEKRYGTSATLADTDADGLNDYLELNQYQTDPVTADTDGDGFDDQEEIDNGYDPNGPGRLAE